MINEKRYQFVPVVIVIVFLAATWLLTPNALIFQDAPPVGSVLAALFTISLFLERSLEVFINTWRSAGRTRVWRIRSKRPAIVRRKKQPSV